MVQSNGSQREREPEHGRTIRVMIVDDHPLVREGLAVRVSSQHDMEVCGSYSNATQARKGICEKRPDVVIVDLALKGEGGLSLIKSIVRTEEGVRFVVFSAYDQRLYAGRAQRAGAHGYVSKQEASSKLLRAIRTVAAGEYYTAADSSGAGTIDAAASERPGRAEDLSDRELEVFQLIGNGYGSQQIAEYLHVSQNTIGTHKENIRRKLGARNSTELLQQAVRWVMENR